MEHQNCKSKTLFPFCFRMFRSSEEQMDCPYHVMGKRSAQTLDWRIKEAINARKEKHLKNNRGEGVIVQSEVDAPEPPLPSPPLPKMSKLFELPDKYKTLNNLFAAMECSIRWLALQNQLPTFRNICTQMEIQTKKKFLISHLAQMKHVFPEAIDLDTGLVHDKITLCMKPEMKVTLLMNAETCSMFPAHSPSRSLWQAFRAKLLELSLTSPEGGEIPEAWLPDPFNRGSYIDRYNVLLGEPPAEVSRYTASIVPRSVYTSGKSSSTAGLTATVAKEPETGEFCIEVLIQMIEGLGSIENFSTEVEES